MKPGKLTPSELASYVFPRCGVRRPDVLVHSTLGVDASVVSFGDEVAVLSTDPITGAGEHAGWLAVHIAANDVAACGAAPIGVLLTLLLAPPTATSDASVLMQAADSAAHELGVEILGGHTEVTDGLTRSLVVATAVGRAASARYVTSAGAREGDTILLTKSAGLEGTAILAADFADRLGEQIPGDVLGRARELLGQISIVPEALAAATIGVSAMHDATEGGVLGALAELGSAAGLGVDVDMERIPVLPETRLICAHLGVDSLCLVSSGALLIATPNPDGVAAAIRRVGRPVAAIGRVVNGSSRLREGGEVRDLVPPDRDSLWDAIERLTDEG